MPAGKKRRHSCSASAFGLHVPPRDAARLTCMHARQHSRVPSMMRRGIAKAKAASDSKRSRGAAAEEVVVALPLCVSICIIG
eukprot:4668644-Amphidinium_carterae.3